MAAISCKINGVDIKVILLAQDMTKFDPGKFDILSLGQPTPYLTIDSPKEVADARYSDNFAIKAIKNMPVGGIIHHNQGFEILHRVMPAEAFGFKEIYSSDYGARIIQKIEDTGERLENTFDTVRAIREASSVLAGCVPGEEWVGYYKNFSKLDDYKEVTLDDLMTVYKERLKKISDFIQSVPDKELQGRLFKRVEFLVVGPIVSNGKLDKRKVLKIHKTSEDPDKPEKNKTGTYTYFGDPREMIHDHNEGNINIFDYYNNVVEMFYNNFPQLKQEKKPRSSKQ